MAFLMVLTHSRRIFLRFSLNARMDSFLLGHVLAFAAFAGVARVLLYDNLKSAVIERVDHASGSAIRFNADLLAFAAAHRYEPRPVAVARGNDRGPREAQERAGAGRRAGARSPGGGRCGRVLFRQKRSCADPHAER